MISINTYGGAHGYEALLLYFFIIQCGILTPQNSQFKNAVSSRYVNCLVVDSSVQNYFDPLLYTKLEFFSYHHNNKQFKQTDGTFSRFPIFITVLINGAIFVYLLQLWLPRPALSSTSQRRSRRKGNLLILVPMGHRQEDEKGSVTDIVFL